ncbi:MAG TPA: hypothetical protein VGA50_08965 [Kiloniellales bacterium]
MDWLIWVWAALVLLALLMIDHRLAGIARSLKEIARRDRRDSAEREETGGFWRL